MNRFRVIAAAILLWLPAAPVLACGGLFCARIPVDQTGEKIVFACDGHQVVAHVQIAYKGDANSFSWIVPVPTPPKLGVGSDMFFTELRSATRPQFQLSIRDEGPCAPPPQVLYKYAPAGRAGGLNEGGNGVTVVSQEQVGPYDTAVLQANDTGVLKAWLRKNDYVIPAKLDPLLDPYVAGKYYFVALKLTKNKAVGDIQPIVMTYKATKPGIPIRLTSVAATPDMDIFVWVLGDHRALPENYRHTRINEARIDWVNFGSNYREVVSRAVDEAGGQAFVTDYAGPSDVMPREKFAREHFQLESLRHETDPVRFAQIVTAQGFFGDRYGALNQEALVAFLKRYIRKSRSLANLDDLTFYRFIEDHAEALREAGITVDAARATTELENKVVKPAEGVGRLLDRFQYLTALYTTMSPDEMTQDPTFRFSSRLKDVPAVRHASGVRRCKPGLAYYQTPIEITLNNGFTFTVPGGGTRYPYFPRRGALDRPDMPYAEAIEQLNPDGPPSLIQDNHAAIAHALAEAAAPDPAPRSASSWAAGGGLVAGLVLLGALGWRRRR